LIFNLIFCFVSAKSQIPSDCNIPIALSNHYDWDVKHLALTRIFTQQVADTNSIVISQAYQDTIWEGLSAIFNLTTNPQRDSVFDKYCIHQYGSCYLFNSFNVRIDTNYSWTLNWRNLITNTGIVELDLLLSTYGFQVTGYWSSMQTVTLTTSQNINIKPVIDSVETFSGVQYAFNFNYIGDGNHIYYFVTGSERLYYFKIGFGDCPSGCIDYYMFKFKVFNDCSVEYIGSELYHSTPEPIPTPTFCNITKDNIINLEEDIEISPNPTSNNILIKCPKHAEIDIINLQGQIVKVYEILDVYSNIDISELSNGIYTFRIKMEKENIIKKILKQ